MGDQDKTKEQLIDELVEMRQPVVELEAVETERRRAQEALPESEEDLRAIFDGVGDGIALIDATGVELRGSLLRKRGRVVGMVGVMRDILVVELRDRCGECVFHPLAPTHQGTVERSRVDSLSRVKRWQPR